MIKESGYTKEVVQNAVAHCLPSDTQPVPEQQFPASFPSLYIEYDIVLYGIGSAVLVPSFLCPPACFSGEVV